jgi:hypothetical protein
VNKLSYLKKTLSFGCALLAGIFLLTTSFYRQQIHPIQSVATQMLPDFSLNDTHILVFAKAMTPSESKRNFGHDLISRGVQPLHLTIQNNTPDEYSLCPSSVDLPRIEPSKIAFKVTQSTIPRAIGYKIASLFFWPFMIPGTIDSIRVFSHHKKLKKDLKAKSMRDEVVAPYSTYNRVLFVPQDQFQSTFKVNLIELESLKSTEFSVEAQ